jgi:hypothetical protein
MQSGASFVIREPYRLATLISAITCIGFSCGCRTLQKPYARSERPSFFEQEIYSRNWTAPDGAVIRFLNATITNFASHGEIMIAGFGETNANQVRCVELYRINRKADANMHDKFVLLDHDWGPREQGWWPSVVLSVEPVAEPKKITFRITRETLPGRGLEQKRLLYFLDYSSEIGVTPNMRELWLAVPEQQQHSHLKK